jgi:putative membrane protein
VICEILIKLAPAKTCSKKNRTPPTMNPESGKPPAHISDHLANERTFLAWIRTSIAVIGLGFVVAKFSVWLKELSARLDVPVKAHHTGLSLPLGVAMMTLGGLLSIVAAWRYRRVRKAIERGDSAAGEHTMMAVTLMVCLITVALVTYMIETR